MSFDILIVDDEDDIRSLVRGILEDEGYSVREAANSDQAYEQVKKSPPSLIILDIWLQGSTDDGLDILKTLKVEHPLLPFVMISGHGTIETAVNAIKDGAYDFIEKPFKSDRLLMLISRALETASLRRENAILKKNNVGTVEPLIGHSQAIENIRQIIERAAPTNSRILITGEAGVGKNIVARLLHENSLRHDEAFMTLNCATLLPEHLESELFGTEENKTTGILEQANGGTLLLDEIADMPLKTQGKIIRVLQEQKFHKIGASESIDVDVRVIATTNKNLEDLITQGDFREDLYYRLNVVPIHMPALKERREDISDLATFFLEKQLSTLGLSQREFTPAAIKMLKTHDWAGNARQLKNVIEWVCIMNGHDANEPFEPQHLPLSLSGAFITDQTQQNNIPSIQTDYMELSLRDAREAFEREYLAEQVERFEGNVSKTAQFVGMERSALHRKLKSLNIHQNKTSDKESLKKRA